MKTCSSCRESKDKSFFGRDKNRKDGLNYVCKSCVLEKSRIYQKMNPEKRKETCKNYRDKNPDRCKESYLKWREKEQAKGWATRKAYELANQEQRKLWKKKWVQNNPEQIKIQKHRRRGAVGTFSKKDIDFLMKSQRGKCVVCLASLLKGKHIDHITPIALGGTNNPTNLQLLCPKCNLNKGAKDPIEFMQSRGFLL